MSPELRLEPSNSASPARICTPFTIPQGILIINETFEVNLTEHAVFRPRCDGGDSGVIHSGFSDNSTVIDGRPPFYASTNPQIYALAAATVISYILVVLIFITPRTYYVGGPGGGAGFLTRRGIGGNSSVIGIGRRPLLQKIATVTVAFSLTLATADTFKVAKKQYADGFMDSEKMVMEVVGALEIRITQVVSDTFVWLAQVQTLIRLFPRHKEKVTIKWLGFALILLDVIFSCLNTFLLSDADARPVRPRDAIPALSYLFELAIGFIYASCVIFYSISKYRLAFYHAKMRNICLVALISITSVLIPVVVFVIDITWPSVATWGFYIRWVGAIAASVVVWEWVERIEALERDETKDGILGREIYDGDEMLDATPVNGADWANEKSRRHGRNGGSNGNAHMSTWTLGDKRLRLRSQFPFQNRQRMRDPRQAASTDTGQIHPAAGLGMSGHAPSPTIVPPISRLDNSSAASTVYTVRYHNEQASSPDALDQGERQRPVLVADRGAAFRAPCSGAASTRRKNSTSRRRRDAFANPFKRKRESPPAEVAGAQQLEENLRPPAPAEGRSDKWNFKSRLDTFTTAQRNKTRAHPESNSVEDALPVTVIPARPRGSPLWSPADASHDIHPSNRGSYRGKVVKSQAEYFCTNDPSVGPSGRDLVNSDRSPSDEPQGHVDSRDAPMADQRVFEGDGEPPLHHSTSDNTGIPAMPGRQSTESLPDDPGLPRAGKRWND